MKKLLGLVFALALLSPLTAAAASFQILSPKAGESYGLGQTMDIKWAHASKGVAMIQMVSARPDGPTLLVYGAIVSGDPVNMEGHYSFRLPTFLIVPPGKYHLRLYLADGSPAVESSTFSFVSASGTAVGRTVKAKYSLGKISGVTRRYQAGDPIHFEVKGFERPKLAATPAHGFNVQAHLYESSNVGLALQAVNASYDAEGEVWAVDLVAPVDSGKYQVQVSLYCGYIGADSYCAQKYDDAQVTKTAKFKVE